MCAKKTKQTTSRRQQKTPLLSGLPRMLDPITGRPLSQKRTPHVAFRRSVGSEKAGQFCVVNGERWGPPNLKATPMKEVRRSHDEFDEGNDSRDGGLVLLMPVASMSAKPPVPHSCMSTTSAKVEHGKDSFANALDTSLTLQRRGPIRRRACQYHSSKPYERPAGPSTEAMCTLSSITQQHHDIGLVYTSHYTYAPAPIPASIPVAHTAIIPATHAPAITTHRYLSNSDAMSAAPSLSTPTTRSLLPYPSHVYRPRSDVQVQSSQAMCPYRNNVVPITNVAPVYSALQPAATHLYADIKHGIADTKAAGQTGVRHCGRSAPRTHNPHSAGNAEHAKHAVPAEKVAGSSAPPRYLYASPVNPVVRAYEDAMGLRPVCTTRPTGAVRKSQSTELGVDARIMLDAPKAYYSGLATYGKFDSRYVPIDTAEPRRAVSKCEVSTPVLPNVRYLH